MDKAVFLNGRVSISTGDITKEQADAIVNAANSTLLGGGGVDGAIHRAGGKSIYEECLEIRRSKYPEGLPKGEAVITGGGELPARYVIHTVGPIYGRNPDQEKLLADCYINSLKLAAERGLKSIAFPSISTGAFSYPKHEAAQIASKAIKGFLETNEDIEQIRLIFFSESDAKKFIKHSLF
jgi:O-acetyl-ADP-ribose deacetylase